MIPIQRSLGRSARVVRDFYEKFPYPKIPLLARVKTANTFALNYQANAGAAFGSTDFLTEKPRILVVGAGTFEPYVVALANRGAQITAVDVSASALSSLRWRLRLNGMGGRVQLKQMVLCDLSEQDGMFDMIVATGVVHHLPEPQSGIRVLVSRLASFGVLRVMMYSKFGRSSIYRIRAMREVLGLERGEELRSIIGKLPSDHPLKIQFALFSDSKHETGIQDGFFHPIDKAYDAWDLERLLAEEGLVATRFLHKSQGHPGALDQILTSLNVVDKSLSPWQKVGVLDRLGELESNYQFLAVRKQEMEYAKEQEPPVFLVGNPVLRKNIPKEIFSPHLDAPLKIGPQLKRLIREGGHEQEMIKMFGTEQIEFWERSLVLVRARRL